MTRGLMSAAAVWFVAATAASAQTTVTVQSGEHDGFTRLALTFGAEVAWEVTRSAQGYVLSVDAPGLRYDLSRVYQRISRQRLSAVWTDPESGQLQLNVACACHALPFEYRPGILVIDLRDGPPPPGSAFERGPDGERMAALTQRAPVRPRVRPDISAPYRMGVRNGYDWIALAIGTPQPAGTEIEAPLPAPFREEEIAALLGEGTADLRRALLYDLARGAAEGAVDLTLVPPDLDEVSPEDLDQVKIHQADALAQMIGLTTGDAAAKMTDEGEVCIGDEALEISDWGDPRPVAQAIGPLTAGLYGEFDRVDTEAAGRAIRYLLSLGFGAEAAGMIRALGMPAEEAQIWATMARVLDGDPDPEGAFAGMAACNTAAALWSVLATPEVPQDEQVNAAAVLRSFSALPPHLRRHLGAALADRMLTRGDTSSVRMVLQAMERTPGEPAPGTTLVGAGLDAANGETPDLDALSALRSATGPEGARAAVALIRAALAAGSPVAPDLIAETEARVTEFSGTPDEAVLRQALAEAHASQGNFDRAFDLAPPDSPGGVPVWAALADRGETEALMARAILPSPAARPVLPPAVRQALARRLIDTGFAEAALIWTGAAAAGGSAVPISMDRADRLLSAEAELLRRNPNGALRQLEGLEGDAEDALRLQALIALNDERAATLAAVLGDDATEAVLGRREGDWSKVAETGPEPWRRAAAHAGYSVAAEAPPLAQSRALLESSAAARADLSALLEATSLDP